MNKIGVRFAAPHGDVHAGVVWKGKEKGVDKFIRKVIITFQFINRVSACTYLHLEEFEAC